VVIFPGKSFVQALKDLAKYYYKINALKDIYNDSVMKPISSK